MDVRDDYLSASGIYLSLIMEKIFKDLREQWMKGTDEGGLSDDQAKDTMIRGLWLDDFISNRIKQKQQEFLMIVRGLYRSMKAAKKDKSDNKVSDDDLMEKLTDIISKTVIKTQFANSAQVGKDLYGAAGLPISLCMLAKNSKYRKLVISMVRICEMEEADKTLTVNHSGSR